MLSRTKLTDQGFAHTILFMLFVVVFGIVGAYYLVSSKADTVSFSLLGTHPQASAQPTAQGKRIGALKVWNGKVYAGYGDYSANTGPIALTPFDIASNSFAATPEWTANTEMIGTMRDYGNKLVVPATDASGGDNETVSIATLTNGVVDWQHWGSTIPSPYSALPITHTFDSALVNGTDIWVVGSDNYDAVAYRSTNNGLTWTEMYRIKGSTSTYYRFYAIADYNGKVYVQAISINAVGNTFNGAEAGSHVYNGTSWSNGPGLADPSYGWWHPTAFAGKLVYMGWPIVDSAFPMSLRTFNGSSVQQITSPTSMLDFTIDGTTLYALNSSGVIYSTTDLTNWYTQATAGSIGASSIAVSNGKIYLGTSDSKIYAGPVNANPTSAGATTTTSGGKTRLVKGGSGGGKGHKLAQ